MTGVVFIVVVLLVAGFIAWAMGLPSTPKQPDEDAVRAALLEGDARIQAEHLQARRAMNDAAGQAWRNLAG